MLIRYERLILFPLALFYCAVLVIAAWPERLTPRGQGGQGTVQMAALYVLARLGWPAGLTVFSGQGDFPDAKLRTCFRISGYRIAGDGPPAREVLFDTMDNCRERTRDFSKDPLERFIDRRLREATDHLANPGTHRDRNAYPLNMLFAIADYYCHVNDDSKGAPYDHVVITSRQQKVVMESGEEKDEIVIEGIHHCREGQWEPVRARKPAADGEAADGR